MDKRKNLFTLVEVLLALGVCAIGVCSIMVLFPVGASASRDAGAETYLANFADEFLRFKQYEILEQNGGQWDSMVKEGGSKKIWRNNSPRDVPAFRELRAGLFVNQADLVRTVQDESSWSQPDGDLIPEMRVLDGHPEVFQINAGSAGTGGYFGESDFRCIAVFWQEDLPEGIPNSLATRLKMEVSWPAEIPYGQRRKRIFTLELFNNARRSQP